MTVAQTATMTTIDPITLEVLWNRILSVCSEQQAALMRTARAEAYERWSLRQQKSALDLAICRHDELPMVGTVDLTNQLPFLELAS